MVSSCRIAIYCQDSLGLGHLRRNTVIARQLLAQSTEREILLFTDSPAGPFFELPNGMDHVKLPSMRKVDAGHWQSPRLQIQTADLLEWRSTLIQKTLLHYQPDLVLVDHMPAGALGELLPALEALHRVRPDCFLVLGLRDILGATDVILRTWESDGAYEALQGYYHRALIYGNPRVFNAIGAYCLPPLPYGIHYCGYVVNRDPVQPAREFRKSAGVPEGRLVYVSAGGGADGDLLMRTYLQAIRLLGPRADLTTLMAVGINAPKGVFYELKAMAQGLPVEIVPSVSDGLSATAAADLVVCMAGYNTLSELLSLGKKSLVVPRSGPSAEQRMRACLFARRSLIDVLDPDDLNAESLANRLLEDLERNDYPTRDEAMDLTGATQAADRITELLGLTPHAHAAKW
jgi:predicted glycosyltransferase